jgi:hypothetical protein
MPHSLTGFSKQLPVAVSFNLSSFADISLWQYTSVFIPTPQDGMTLLGRFKTPGWHKSQTGSTWWYPGRARRRLMMRELSQ